MGRIPYDVRYRGWRNPYDVSNQVLRNRPMRNNVEVHTPQPAWIHVLYMTVIVVILLAIIWLLFKHCNIRRYLDNRRIRRIIAYDYDQRNYA